MQNSHIPIPLQPGYRLQNWYRIERVLGQGDCGVTYLAQDCNLERAVVIKEYLPARLAVRNSGVFVQPETAYGEDAYHIGLEAFLDEARLLAKVEHPNLPSIINVFVAQNTAYVVMSYEEGESLEAVLQERRTLEEAELLQLLMPLLGILEKVHDSGHIHGDIKPAHVLLRGDGSPVLVEFGATRRAVAEQTHSSVHISPGYSAPEQYFTRGDGPGASTDIYGLAATLYRAVTGVAPPDALERSEAAISGAGDPLMPARQVADLRYSEYLLQAIDSALNLDQGQRPQSVAAWRRQFGVPPEGWQSAPASRREIRSPLSAHRARSRAGGHPGKHLRVRLIAGGLLALALLGLGTRAWLHRQKEAAGQEPLASSQPIAAPSPGQSPSVGAGRAASGGSISAPPDTSLHGSQTSVDVKVAELLSRGREDMNAGRLTTPKESNALDDYRAVLALRPDQNEAKQGLRQIADELIRLSRAAMADHDWEVAQERLDQAGSVLPDLDRLGMAREELQARKRELSRERRTAEEAAKPAQTIRTPAQLAASARQAIQSGQLKQAESYIDRITRITPDAEELAELRKALEEARQGAQNQPPPGSGDSPAQNRAVRALVRRVHRAMDRRQWEKAQEYLDKATSLAPDAEELTLLQGELNVLQASVRESESPKPAESNGSPAAASAVRQAETVKIHKASVSLPSAHPGETVEFFTEYELTLPEAEQDRQVTATWALTKNGRRLGQEGSESSPAKSGTHSASTELVLPPYMKPGTYVVEHRVEAGHSRDVARSTFRVETN